jgi:hypothetical protein
MTTLFSGQNGAQLTGNSDCSSKFMPPAPADAEPKNKTGPSIPPAVGRKLAIPFTSDTTIA